MLLEFIVANWGILSTGAATIIGAVVGAWKAAQLHFDKKYEKQVEAADKLAAEQTEWRNEILKQVGELRLRVQDLTDQNYSLVKERAQLISRVAELEITIKKHEATIEKLQEVNNDTSRSR